ncbi:MAG: alanine racemase [Lachnospiraceae bacterium]|nr:alanine racemase [Lachnospiraceae bacterium]
MNLDKRFVRTRAEIDLDAIRLNFMQAREKIGPDVKLLAVVKADGYGHGALRVMQEIDDLADAYGVAEPGEALQLREAGCEKTILILGFVAHEWYADMIAHDITLAAFTEEMTRQLSEEALRQGKKAQIHLKIDTGMSRIGMAATKENVALVQKMAAYPGVEITGMFTHFACADQEDKTSAREQFARFTQFADWLLEVGIEVPVKHAANSAAIMEMPETYLDMVRCGITLYGMYPSDGMQEVSYPLHPAMSWRARVSYVKELPAGVGIGYGLTYVTKEPRLVATIPVGYADGYSRAQSNRARVLIHGRSCPILGRVCMDQFMVDVTDVPDVKEGDDVTLLGRDGEECISAEEMGTLSESFNYEVVCDIGKRVPRLYLRGGKIVD